LFAKKAFDHDMEVKTKLVPTWILEVETGISAIFFWESSETSNYIVDCLQKWLNIRKYNEKWIETIVINLDNWPAINSHTTQFIKRMILLSKDFNVKIRLIYYPPYHSKYNPIERLWGVLENFWNWAILETIDIALKWASNMTRKGINPIVESVKWIYEKGIKVWKDELNELKKFWVPSKNLKKWDISIDARKMVL
jgi:transposase